MRDPLVVSFKECQHLRWTPLEDVGFAQDVALVPLTSSELSAAACSMPMAFVKQGRSWSLVGVCGVELSHNLFVRKGQWLGAYKPNWLQNWPFDLMIVREKAYLVFDKASGALVKQGGEPFFESEHTMGPALSAISERMRPLAQAVQQTAKAIQLLSEAGVLVSWPESIRARVDGFSIPGLHMLDEKALAGLDDQAFLRLRSLGALTLGYAVNLSLGQTHIISRLQKLNPPAITNDIADLEAFFEEDDNLSFQLN